MNNSFIVDFSITGATVYGASLWLHLIQCAETIDSTIDLSIQLNAPHFATSIVTQIVFSENHFKSDTHLYLNAFLKLYALICLRC